MPRPWLRNVLARVFGPRTATRSTNWAPSGLSDVLERREALAAGLAFPIVPPPGLWDAPLVRTVAPSAAAPPVHWALTAPSDDELDSALVAALEEDVFDSAPFDDRAISAALQVVAIGAAAAILARFFEGLEAPKGLPVGA